MTRVLALSIRPLEAADTRYRILRYVPFLAEAGLKIEHRSLISPGFYRRQQKKRLGPADALAFAGRLFARAATVARAGRYDVVWICRELAPLGPPLLERLLFSRPKVRVVLDVDDALFIPDHLGGFLHKRLRDFKKYEYITPRCAATVVGNKFLADYYGRFTRNVFVIPTCVDHEQYAAIPRSPSPDGRVRIGWIGTPVSRGHLELIRGPMERLARRHSLEFRAVGLTAPLPWDMDRVSVIPWRLEAELSYFADFDIGVMPLEDTRFTRGKCAFKLIQYMAAGVPAVASPVGANCETLVEGGQGFFADAPEAWEKALETLIVDEGLRRRLGESGRARVRDQYSLARHWPRYAEILKGTVRTGD